MKIFKTIFGCGKTKSYSTLLTLVLRVSLASRHFASAANTITRPVTNIISPYVLRRNMLSWSYPFFCLYFHFNTCWYLAFLFCSRVLMSYLLWLIPQLVPVYSYIGLELMNWLQLFLNFYTQAKNLLPSCPISGKRYEDTTFGFSLQFGTSQ